MTCDEPLSAARLRGFAAFGRLSVYGEEPHLRVRCDGENVMLLRAAQGECDFQVRFGPEDPAGELAVFLAGMEGDIYA